MKHLIAVFSVATAIAAISPVAFAQPRGSMESGRIVGPNTTFDPQVDTSIFSADGVPDSRAPNADLPARIFSPSTRDQPRPFDTVPGYRQFDDVLQPYYDQVPRAAGPGSPLYQQPSFGYGAGPRGTDPGARSRVFDTRRGTDPPYIQSPLPEITTPPGIATPRPAVPPGALPPGIQPNEPPGVGPQGADLPGVIPYPYSSPGATTPQTTPGASPYSTPRVTTPQTPLGTTTIPR